MRVICRHFVSALLVICLAVAKNTSESLVVANIEEINFNLNKQDQQSRKSMSAAITQNDEATVKQLLEAEFNPNTILEDGQTPLILASRNNRITIIHLLLQAGATVDFVNLDSVQNTALMLACSKNHIDTVKVLIEAGANINAKDKDGWTPLMHAAGKGHASIVQYLLDANALPNERNNNGDTALATASKYGQLESVRILLSAHANAEIADNNGWTALLVAAAYGHKAIVDMLIIKGADVNAANIYSGVTPLMAASRANHATIVESLLNAGAMINAQDVSGSTALIHACHNNSAAAARVLVEKNCSLDIQEESGWMALMMSSYDGNAYITQLLVDAGANTALQNNDGMTALHLSTERGHLATEKILLEVQTDTNIQDRNGYTALALASSWGRTDFVRELLLMDADPNIPSHNGWTPIMFAAGYGYSAIVNLFIEAGARINEDGTTPLMAASRANHATIVESLLNAGAMINAQDGAGWTALIHACHNNSAAAARVLVEKSCSLDIQEEAGWTALMKSSYHGNAYITQLLVDVGANTALQNNDGMTALLLSAERGHLATAKILANIVAPHDKDAEQHLVVAILPTLKSIIFFVVTALLMVFVLITSRAYLYHRDHTNDIRGEESAPTYPAAAIPARFIHIADVPIKTTAYSHVYRGTYRSCEVVIKMICGQRNGINAARVQQSEITILSTLRHPRILMLLGVVQDLPATYGALLGLVTEFMPRGSLYDVLHSNQTPAEFRLHTLKAKLRVLKDVSDGMRFLHASRVIHRDLKSPNILLDNDGHAKICDFGVSRLLSIDTTHASTMAGTAHWMSPEALEGLNITQASDVYSFGVVMWEIMTGQIPWDGLTAVQVGVQLSHGRGLKLPETSETCPQTLISVMESCLDPFPNGRPTFCTLFDALHELILTCQASYPCEFLCPITYEVMADPVLCSDNHTYDRENILRWFRMSDRSPITNVTLVDFTLRRNIALKSLMDKYQS